MLSTSASANNQNIQNELQNMAASIRFAEQQSSRIDARLNELKTKKVELETKLNKYAYETARQIHAYHVIKKSPARLSFLHHEKSFLNHYYALRTQESMESALVHNLSSYGNQLNQLNDTQTHIQDHLKEKDDLKISIASLLKTIKTQSKQVNSEAFTEKLEILKSRHTTLNNFLSDLINIKNLNYTASKYPEFSMPLSGIVEQQNNRLLIKSYQNALVTAPAAGRVLYANEFKNLGIIIIIDHGYGYISILRGLKNVIVDSGYVLNENDPIGIIGGDEWNKGKNSAILYYDLRYNNDSINPIDKITGL